MLERKVDRSQSITLGTELHQPVFSGLLHIGFLSTYHWRYKVLKKIKVLYRPRPSRQRI